eukprot:CAMPEP_0182942024 /NCGR_PEP_ID=MMETSP0105_2-20130417/49895_1 /TAXON_ID=81532 ORGANISM="Acanthoeca-like sp., Strain 10tr" /NCGR_SAMPLE_ID=MMETSP0105_2 /ASSEMBLY_ACC=CAM_ASM_000205 /LENGTH=33 /DNA_ID= /DNA_START= /DNA_END= /DNA_ORIENTATION=
MTETQSPVSRTRALGANIFNLWDTVNTVRRAHG